MIDDRIGNIGSTHGVNDNARPIPKNAAITSQKRPLLSTLSTREPSNQEPDDAGVLPPAVGAVAGVALGGVGASAAASGTRALPSPPNATRLTCAVLVIGG